MPHEQSRSPAAALDFRGIADKIVTECVGVQAGEVVQLGGGVHNFALVAALAAAVRRVGAFPELNVTSDGLQVETMTTVAADHLRTVPPHRLRWLQDVDALIVTDAVADPNMAAKIPAEKRQAAHAAAEVVERRIFEQGIRWAYVGYPTRAALEPVGISYDDVAPLFWRAVDADYAALAADGGTVADVLRDADEVRVVSDKGTDVTFAIGKRPVLVDDGVMPDHDGERGAVALNLPAGQVLVAPLEASVQGKIVFDFAYNRGKTATDVVVHVTDGQVRLEGAATGRRLFEQAMAGSEGNKDRIGKFGLGLNPGVDRFTGYAPTDEKRRGAVRFGLGDNRMLGGQNPSTLRWDLFIEKPTVYVDGTPLVVAGRLFPDD